MLLMENCEEFVQLLNNMQIHLLKWSHKRTNVTLRGQSDDKLCISELY